MAIKCPKCQSDNPDTKRFCGECGTQLLPSDEISPSLTKTLEIPVEELTTGSTFAGRYQIIEELGKGGMGKVYKANDIDIKEKVAIKLIKPEIATDKKTIERFQNELKFARKIRHKNVCQMYDLNKEEGTYYITMEYVEGENLKNMIRMSGQFGIGTAISVAKQVCEGLEEAHKLGVIHRDLKPSNIMIDREGNVRIMDFGIARSLKEKGITGAGVMIGTPEYMSPEQVEGKETDQRSDIYSLGINLYEMVTGRVPFEGDTPFTIGMKHKGEMPKDPRELNAQIPETLSHLILKCMEKDKEKRYQSAGELQSELTYIEKGIPITEKVVPKRKPITSKEITVQFNLKKLFIPALIVIALLITVGYFIFRSGREIVDIKIGHTKQLTRAPGMEIDTAISPDGKLIAYTKGPIGEFRIYVRQIAGGRTISLTKDLPGQQRWPKWSSDGTRISFQSGGAIYVIPALGGIPKQLVKSPDEEKVISVAWSPDGQQIVFAHGNTIYTRSVDRGEPKKITEAFEPHSLNWSPDGTKIAFHSFRTGNRDIFVMSTDGGSIQQITSDPAQDRRPDWSLDGNKLVFRSDRTGRYELYVISRGKKDSAWGTPRQLTFDGGTVNRWSPDGRLIVYTSGNSLRVISPEGGDPQELVRGQDIVRTTPGWFPDGQTIYFYTFGEKWSAGIWSVPASGGAPKLLVRFDNPALKPDRDIATDGKSFFLRIVEFVSDIWMMELLKYK